jgi:hypothetical protein
LDSREKRLVENQRAFRMGNERLLGAVETMVDAEAIPFLCECMDDRCMARVELTLDQYAGVRSRENRFVIVRDHPTLPGERVVHEDGPYQIVEKPGM